MCRSTGLYSVRAAAYVRLPMCLVNVSEPYANPATVAHIGIGRQRGQPTRGWTLLDKGLAKVPTRGMSTDVHGQRI